jgi:hypothetical protein
LPPVILSELRHNAPATRSPTLHPFRVEDGEAFQSCNLTEDLVRSHELVNQSLALQPERNRNLNRVERTKPQIWPFSYTASSSMATPQL